MNALRIFLHELRSRWLAPTVTVASIFLMLFLTMAVLRTMDLDALEAYPQAMREMMGIPDGASPEAFGYGSVLTLMAALALGGVAVAIGADTTAGEERRRTTAAVLSNPIGRRSVMLAKAIGFVAIIALAMLALWATTELTGLLLDVEAGEAHLWELCVAIGANALLHGAVAFALGAITGDKGLAGGIAGGLLAVGWLASSIMPMVPEYADSAKYVPYGWFTEQNVLLKGLDAGYLGLQLGLTVVLLALGAVWFVRRDLRTIAPKTLKERLAGVPLLKRFSGRGARRPASLFGLFLGRSRTLLIVVSLVMGIFTLMMGPVWDEVEGDAADLAAGMPEDIMALFGAAGDVSTPAGFLWGEMFGLMAPAAAIIVTVAVASGLATEEGSGRLGMILAQPVRRSRLLAAAAAALVAYLLILSIVQGLSTWATVEMSTLDIPMKGVVGATVHMAALGLCIGGIAFLVAAATGSSKATTWTATGAGVIGHFGYAALALSDETAPWAKVSPFHYYASTQPLANGADWGHVAILAAVGVLATALAFPLFQRRDLRV